MRKATVNPKMGGEKAPTQIIMAALVKASFSTCVHGQPSSKGRVQGVGIRIGGEEDETFIELRGREFLNGIFVRRK